jgi:hypothetical protein
MNQANKKKEGDALGFHLMKEKCMFFFQNEDIQCHIREIVKPIGTLIYNELFIYIWLICIYNVLLFCIVIFVLVVLLRKEYRH